jgi:hypothetical protein
MKNPLINKVDHYRRRVTAMTIFIETIQSQLAMAHRALDEATVDDDLYTQDVDGAVLEDLHRIAALHNIPCMRDVYQPLTSA